MGDSKRLRTVRLIDLSGYQPGYEHKYKNPFQRSALALLEQIDLKISRVYPITAEFNRKTGAIVDYNNNLCAMISALDVAIESIDQNPELAIKMMKMILDSVRQFKTYTEYLEARFDSELSTAGTCTKKEFIEALLNSGNAKIIQELGEPFKVIAGEERIDLVGTYLLIREMSGYLGIETDSMIGEGRVLPHIPTLQKMLDEASQK